MKFEPEPDELLKSRFPAALRKVWNPDLAYMDRPGLHREHVFDFDCGLRMIISRDRLKPDEAPIHISVSWIENLPVTIEEATKQVEEKYKILGGTGSVKFIGLSDNGVPHFFIEVLH